MIHVAFKNMLRALIVKFVSDGWMTNYQDLISRRRFCRHRNTRKKGMLPFNKDSTGLYQQKFAEKNQSWFTWINTCWDKDETSKNSTQSTSFWNGLSSRRWKIEKYRGSWKWILYHRTKKLLDEVNILLKRGILVIKNFNTSGRLHNIRQDCNNFIWFRYNRYRNMTIMTQWATLSRYITVWSCMHVSVLSYTIAFSLYWVTS